MAAARPRSAPPPAPPAPAAALGAAAWLEQNLQKAADELSSARRARPGFSASVAETLRKRPIQAWEADRWLRGMKLRLLKMEAFFFRAGTQKRAATSLFVRNEAGLNVGLRREALTQMATYVSLVTDYGYPRGLTRFESRFMDVLVLDRAGRPWIYAENKAADATLRRLCDRLENEFWDEVPRVDMDGELAGIDDAVMKASHIWTQRPTYFWAVSPGLRKSYEIIYGRAGFRLQEVPDMPTVDELPASPVL